MILAGLQADPDHFRNKVGLWFVGNQAALKALFTSRRGHYDVDELALVIHSPLYAF